ncbi:hypothetical protein BGZ49_007475 [Haplosporangium sp. Z 27]|nr:hypothetical protein BGZ49_007475 [Haplosporangium sp. Z 27]
MFIQHVDFLVPEEKLNVQVAAAYALYLLYFTQPSVFKKIPIRLTTASWKNLESLYKTGFENDLADLVYILHKLRDQESFVYIAQNKKITEKIGSADINLKARTEGALIRLESKLNSTNLVPTEPLLRDISKLAAEYRNVKANLISVSLARRSSHIVMKHLRKLKAPDMDPEEMKPTPTFLGEREALVGPIVTHATSSSSTIHNSTAGKRTSEQSSPIAHSPVDNVITGLETSDRSSITVESHIPTGDNHAENEMDKHDYNENFRTHLPFIFPFSMLQASKSEFPIELEEVVRRHHRNRVVRYKFAAAGGLSRRNEYTFGDLSLIENRKKKRKIMSSAADENQEQEHP